MKKFKMKLTNGTVLFEGTYGEVKAMTRVITDEYVIDPPLPPMGRPRVGTVILPAITVPCEIKEGIDALAAETGISAPEMRRGMYEFMIKCARDSHTKGDK